MKNTNAIPQEKTTSRDCVGTNIVVQNDLLETIKNSRANIGDDLDDTEFTLLLREKHLPAEGGFRFLSLHKGCVALTVPLQDYDAWYPQDQWISAEKETMAAHLAKKHGLMVAEPPNVVRRGSIPGAVIHHHLQFFDRKDVIIVAHPEYLKIRLYASESDLVLPRKPGLLRELAGLYQTNILADLAADLART